MHAKKRHFSCFTLPFYKGEICITIALNRDGLETSGENVHNESCSAQHYTTENRHQRTGRGAGGAAAAAAAVGKNSIIRAKLMYRSGKETVKNILLFNILI